MPYVENLLATTYSLQITMAYQIKMHLLPGKLLSILLVEFSDADQCLTSKRGYSNTAQLWDFPGAVSIQVFFSDRSVFDRIWARCINFGLLRKMGVVSGLWGSLSRIGSHFLVNIGTVIGLFESSQILLFRYGYESLYLLRSRPCQHQWRTGLSTQSSWASEGLNLERAVTWFHGRSTKLEYRPPPGLSTGRNDR